MKEPDTIKVLRSQVTNVLRPAGFSCQMETDASDLQELAEQFKRFHDRYSFHFQPLSSQSEEHARKYLGGLLQSSKRNIERMVEKVPESDYEALHYFISESPWEWKPILEQIAQEVNQ